MTLKSVNIRTCVHAEGSEAENIFGHTAEKIFIQNLGLYNVVQNNKTKILTDVWYGFTGIHFRTRIKITTHLSYRDP